MDYTEGEWNGEGIMYWYDEKGAITYKYEGCFANGAKWGYGTMLGYDDSGSVTYRYRGSYTAGVKSGFGVSEYISSNDNKYVYVGYHKNDAIGGEGAIYAADGTKAQSGVFSNGSLDESKDLYEKYPFPSDCIWK